MPRKIKHPTKYNIRFALIGFAIGCLFNGLFTNLNSHQDVEIVASADAKPLDVSCIFEFPPLPTTIGLGK